MHFLQQFKPYFKQIAILSYPIIIGQLGIVLMGVVDVMMVGKLPALNLAAISLSNAVYFLICILGIGTLTAISPLVAKSKGAGNPNQCAILFKQSLVASLLLSGIISLAIYMLTENLEILQQTPQTIELAKSYLHILNVGTLPMLVFTALKNYSDGLSFTKASAVITLLALGVNALLCYIFIYGHFGSDRMELYGAGLATTLSRVFMALVMLAVVLLHKQYKPFLKRKQAENNLAHLKEIFVVGLPSGFQYFFEIGAFAFAAIMMGWISENAMAAHQVAISIASVTYMIATGISAGGAILVGDALGRKNKKDLMNAGRAALILGASFMGLCALVMSIFTYPIIQLYTQDPAVIPIAATLLYIAALFQLSDGIQCVGLGILRGLGDTKMPTLFTIIAYWGIGIPVGYLLGFYFNFGAHGIWIALLLGLSFSALLLSTRFLKESRELNLNPPHVY